MAFTVTQTATAIDTTNKTVGQTWSFASQSVGTASSDRFVFVAVTTDNSLPTAVTIGGNSATQCGSGVTNSADASCSLWYYNLTSGTTATIVVTAGGTDINCSICVYTATGQSVINVTSTASDTTDSSGAWSNTLDIPNPGIGFGIAAANNLGAHTYTWTNLTEDVDHQRELESASINHQSSYAHSTTNGSSTRTATSTGTLGLEGCLYLVAIGDGTQPLTQSSSFSDGETFNTHTIVGGDLFMTQSASFSDADTFYAPTVALVHGIQCMGTATGTNTSGTDFAITLPAGTTTDDLVVVASCIEDSFSTETPGPTTAGYTSVATITTNTRFDVSYKKMTGTPDTSVTINAGTGTFKATSAVVMVFRGVDTTTPMDATATTANSSGGSPDNPSITPVTNFATVVAFAGSEVNDTSISPPTDYGNVVSASVSGVVSSCTAGATKSLSTPAAEDPASWSTITSSGGWAAVTVALRPAAQPIIASTLYSDADTFFSATVELLDRTLTQSATFSDPDTFYLGTSAITIEDVVVSDSDQGAFGQSNGLATFTGLSVGTASADRLVFVYMYGAADVIDAETPTVTIGGVTATNVSSASSFANLWATNAGGQNWWWANVPSGTTADVTIDAGAGHTWSALHVVLYAASGVDTTTPVFQTAYSDATTPSSVTLDIDTDGTVILGSLTVDVTTWDAPSTEDVDQTASDGVGVSGAHYSATDPETDTVFGATGSITLYIQGLSLSPGGAGGGLTVALDTAQNLTPSLYSDGDTFYSATVAATYALTPSLYSDSDTFYSATVAATYALTPSLYSDGDTFFSPTVAPGAVNLAPSLYSDADTFYSATVAPGAVNLTPSLYSDADTFFSPTVAATYALTPSLYSDGDTFHSPTVAATYALTPSLYTDADTFFSPTVAATYALTPSLYSDGDTFYSPTVAAADQPLTPSLYSDADTFYSATVTATYALTPSLYSDGDAFYAPTVSFVLFPSLYSDADTFHSATVTPGAVNLSPSLYSDADTFYSATVASVYPLTPSLYSDADTFYSATITTSYALTPSLYSDADTFFSPTVTPGAINLQPSLYSDADTFFSPTVAATYALTPALYSDADTFFSATVAASYTLTPSLYSDGDTFYSATVTPGEINLQPSLYSDGDTFFSSTVAASYTLTPSLFADGDTFFDPTVTAVYPLTPSLYSDADTFFGPTVAPGAVNLAPSLYSDGDTFYAHILYVLTTIQPDADITDGNWVNELGSNVDLYASVDEASPSDSDYIRSGDAPSADIVRLRLSNHDATPNEPYRVRYRYERGGTLVTGTLELKARLLQGGTTIAEWTHSNIAASFVDADQTLLHSEFINISDFTDLNVEFEATYAA